MAIKFSNNASAQLASAITNAATTITVTAGQGAMFPVLSAGDYFFASVVDASNNIEIVKCTARTTDTLTVLRGQDGTTARAYSAGDKLELRPTAAGMDAKLDKDGSVTMTGALPMGGNKVTGLAQGTASGEAVHAGRAINTTAPISGGGNLGGDLTLTHDTSGVAAGSYGSSSAIPTFTVNDKGHLTAAGTVPLDLSVKVSKAGDSMTGALKGSGSSATTTGFQINNGTDLGSLFVRAVTPGGATSASITNGVLSVSSGYCGYCTHCGYCNYCDYCNYCNFCNCNCCC